MLSDSRPTCDTDLCEYANRVDVPLPRVRQFHSHLVAAVFQTIHSQLRAQGPFVGHQRRVPSYQRSIHIHVNAHAAVRRAEHIHARPFDAQVSDAPI